ncbi:uncharacterized protein PgNI_08923 [Pyricularia grisea]|uniref:FAD dependent oxidoreductase domain-containing protein n=1 Tax=Pyricularia grisea TaxID=148305 RepID=A0A6P8AVV1_PYRGI|nr:uncharacterized protein PgNI_08923 [Pyricularia grisea]TLD06358.1 hypothetical protein PgNI_08923 [Pyricularia grisea]
MGNGITGAAVAWHLLEDATEVQMPKVIMLEAREVCSGDTGRNGRVEAAKAAVAAMQDAMPGDKAAKYDLVEAGEAQQQYFCGDLEGRLCGALRYPACSINAYCFATGVLKLCLAKGLQIHANTPATLAAKGADGNWQINTTRGTMTAKEVVLATNGYTATLDPRFQGVVVPVRGQVTAQRPGSKMRPQGLTLTYSFIYHDGFEYMVSRRAEDGGDIIIGGGLYENGDRGVGEAGNTNDTVTNKVISSYLRDVTPRYFGTSWGENHPEG